MEITLKLERLFLIRSTGVGNMIADQALHLALLLQSQQPFRTFGTMPMPNRYCGPTATLIGPGCRPYRTFADLAELCRRGDHCSAKTHLHRTSATLD
jgi:hypothetical protein